MLCAACANSYTLPDLPIGESAFNRALTSSLMIAVMGVAKMAGAIAATRIEYLPRSRAIGNTRPLIAPLLALYATCPLYPSSAATLLVNRITPLSDV